MEMLFDDTDKVDEIVNELWLVPDWPKDPAKDRALVAELQRQFPDAVLVDELQKFRVWLLAQADSRKVVTSRGRYQRLRNWFVRAGHGVVPQGRRSTGGSRPCRTSARPAAAFGAESSRVLTGW